MRNRTFLSLSAPVALALAWPLTAQAKTVKGPSVSVEQAQSSTVKPADGSLPDTQVARRRTVANLLVPIPAAVLGGMLVMKDDFFKEERTYSGKGAGPQADDIKNPNAAALGAIYLPHPKEGAPRFFVAMARYGELSVFRDKAKTMGEYVIGADIADTDMPFALKFLPTDQAETRLLIRYRQYPGFHKWLVLIGHKIVQAYGFSLDVTIPSQIIAAFDFGGGAWSVYSGIRWVSRDYPFATGAAVGWTDGYTTTRLLGVRRQLVGPLYLALEGGAQKEDLRYVDDQGEELEKHSTAFAPWMKVALETWVKTP